MRLLVSVRSAEEVEPALAGGADIVDAKEPANGSLGAVAPGILAEILRSVPPHHPFSIALGDARSAREVATRTRRLVIPARSAPVYLKIGFAGTLDLARIGRIIAAARPPAAALGCHLVAVAYADWEQAGCPDPFDLVRLAGESGCDGALLDTHRKEGGGLLRCFGPTELRRWVREAAGWGLATALAGQLKAADLDLIRGIQPDIVGVRGAACEGGRGGRVVAARVRALQEVLTSGGAAHRQNCPRPDDRDLGETRETGAEFSEEPELSVSK